MTRKGLVGTALLLGLVGAAPRAAAQVLVPGRVIGEPDRAGNIVLLRTERAVVRLEFCTEALVRVRVRFAGAFRPDEHIMVARTTWPAVDLRVRDAGDVVDILASRIGVRVHREPFRLEFIDTGTGRTVAAEDAAEDGGVARDSGGLRERMRLRAAEQFFGFGERMDRFNWRGHSVTLDVGRGQHPNHDLGAYRIDAANYCPVPFVLSTGGYAIFFHTAQATTWDMGASAPSRYEFRADDDELDYYFFLGPLFGWDLGPRG
jgi:alpha-glucosidase (family GH31 glycosyl hydrolase)